MTGERILRNTLINRFRRSTVAVYHSSNRTVGEKTWDEILKEWVSLSRKGTVLWCSLLHCLLHCRSIKKEKKMVITTVMVRSQVTFINHFLYFDFGLGLEFCGLPSLLTKPADWQLPNRPGDKGQYVTREVSARWHSTSSLLHCCTKVASVITRPLLTLAFSFARGHCV